MADISAAVRRQCWPSHPMPHCGEGIPSTCSSTRPGRSSDRLVVLLAGAALVVGLVFLGGRAGSAPKTVALPQAAAEDTVQPAPDTTSPPTPTAAAAAVAPPPADQPPAARSALRRYARTWVNVRAGRSGAAPGVRILSPGESILVDSLRRGWYRVLADGRAQGYVDRTFLDTVPPVGRQ
jgi:hypothetical protein